jgi:hypothetical protein
MRFFKEKTKLNLPPSTFKPYNFFKFLIHFERFKSFRCVNWSFENLLDVHVE